MLLSLFLSRCFVILNNCNRLTFKNVTLNCDLILSINLLNSSHKLDSRDDWIKADYIATSFLCGWYLTSNSIVIVDRVKYKKKRIHKIYKKLVDFNSMSEETGRHLKPVGTRPGIMYGSCKVHKKCVDGCPPFRPILSALQTPTYKLAKYLVPILELLTTNKFTHCVKSFQIRSYFWPVFYCIRIEYRKIRTRNNSVFGQFSRSDSQRFV